VLVVGLTGNFGMGKSTVLKMFSDMGAASLDVDQIVDVLLRDSAVLRKVKDSFGKRVFCEDGELDRAALAAAIFADSEKRELLERVLHPLVFEKIESFLEGILKGESDHEIVIVEVPLLFETGYAKRFSRKITVYTDESIAFDRLAGKGVTREDAMKRLSAQMPINEKVHLADFTIDNSGTKAETERQVRMIYEKLLAELRMKDC